MMRLSTASASTSNCSQQSSAKSDLALLLRTTPGLPSVLLQGMRQLFFDQYYAIPFGFSVSFASVHDDVSWGVLSVSNSDLPFFFR